MGKEKDNQMIVHLVAMIGFHFQMDKWSEGQEPCEFLRPRLGPNKRSQLV